MRFHRRCSLCHNERSITEISVMAGFAIKRILVRSAYAYGVLILILTAVGGWLTYDFWSERERTVVEVSRLAMHKSQLISALFGDTFIAADYVLHDVADHIDFALAHRSPLVELTPLLGKKLATVPALTQLAILDQDCNFTALGKRVRLLFTRSNQSFCSAQGHEPGQSLHIQYMPAERSANGKPVVLMSRVIYSKEGRIQAAAMAVIELDYAQRWIESFTVDTYDVQTIIDSDGVIVARNPPLPKELGRRTIAPPGQPPFEQITGSTTFTARSPLDDRERVFGISRLEHFPFITLVGYDKARALKGWWQRAWQFGCGYVLLVLLSIAFLRAHLKTIAQSQALHTLATTDALTGIANRRQLFVCGEREIARAIRHGQPLAVLMIDIDLFKRINDRWGHPSGDRVIRNIADLLRSTLRTIDTYSRLGGEEFTAILPETDATGASALAERLRLAIEAAETVVADDGQIIHHTVSIGVSILGPNDKTFDKLLQRADRALYQAKESGRNRIAISADSD